eukprot:scaffold144179_cov23-Prasinocladus_malaysianus.AAC.1
MDPPQLTLCGESRTTRDWCDGPEPDWHESSAVWNAHAPIGLERKQVAVGCAVRVLGALNVITTRVTSFLHPKPLFFRSMHWQQQLSRLHLSKFVNIQGALRQRCAVSGQGFSGAMHVAVVDSTMNGMGPSTECLPGKTCRPIGGHNVWAAMPPLPEEQGGTDGWMSELIVSSSSVTTRGARALYVGSHEACSKVNLLFPRILYYFSATPSGLEPDAAPVILVTAQTDTDGFFRQLAQGADSPMSGLIAMLVAADVLWQAGQASKYTK